MNWKHIAGVAWLLAVTGLVLYGQPLAAVLVFAAGAAVLAVDQWVKGLGPDGLSSALAPVLAVAVAGLTAHVTTIGDGESIQDEVDDNTAAIEQIDEVQAAAADARRRAADDENLPVASPCDMVLAGFDRLSPWFGELAVSGGEERLHTAGDFARAVTECAAEQEDEE